MRVYLPVTSTDLRTLLESGSLGSPPVTAFAVTPGLREWYVDDDIEELEYAAMLEAARGSLRLIDSEAQAASRRIVLAVDAADESVDIRDDLDRGVVHLTVTVSLSRVASAHVDDASAQDAVRAAAGAITAADLGDPTAQDSVDDVEGFELSWFATQELAGLLDSL